MTGINNDEISRAALAAVEAFEGSHDAAQLAVWYAFRAFATNIASPPLTPLRDGVLPTYETLTPTSELLDKSAHMIRDLMLGRGVDRRNGFSWEAFVRELYDRAAAFKQIEDTP